MKTVSDSVSMMINLCSDVSYTEEADQLHQSLIRARIMLKNRDRSRRVRGCLSRDIPSMNTTGYLYK